MTRFAFEYLWILFKCFVMLPNFLLTDIYCPDKFSIFLDLWSRKCATLKRKWSDSAPALIEKVYKTNNKGIYWKSILVYIKFCWSLRSPKILGNSLFLVVSTVYWMTQWRWVRLSSVISRLSWNILNTYLIFIPQVFHMF